VTVRGVDDTRDRALDRKFDVPRRTGPAAAQEALHRTGITAVVDEVSERGGVG
jgi:hypothetical protein